MRRKMICRVCDTTYEINTQEGRPSIYCSSECRTVYKRRYNTTYTKIHRADVRDCLERLYQLEDAIERGELVYAQTT